MKHESIFPKNKSSLLLIDYQEKFVPVLHDEERTRNYIKFLLLGINIYKLPVFVSEQVPDKLGKTIEDLTPLLEGAEFFSKTTMSCCGEKSFVKSLKDKGIEHVAVCGIEAHICVLQTCLDLMQEGFKVHIVADAVTCRIPHNKDIAIKKFISQGGFITSVETLLFELVEGASGKEFKELQGLYKLNLLK